MQAEPPVCYASYDIQRYFCHKPDGPVRCLRCSGNLSKATIEPSQAMKNEIADPGYDFRYGSSALFVCNLCRWWCIREHYEFIDKDRCHQYGDDYLIVSTQKNRQGETLGSMPDHLWLKAHDDPRVYDAVQGLSNELATLFDGGMSWDQKYPREKIGKG